MMAFDNRIPPLRLLACIVALLACAQAGAATRTAASCSRTDVLASIAVANPGDTVSVPAGTCSWSGGISISGIQLVGAGSSTNGTIVTAGTVRLTKQSSQYTRLSGFRFTGTDPHIVADGSASAKPYIIDHNYVRSDVSGQAFQLRANGGLVHHNEFVAINWTGSDVFNIPTGEDWSQPPTFGADDTTGERNIYLEDNTFTNIVETSPDADGGSRVVIRGNTYNDSSIVIHGGYPTDSSGNGGTRQFEVYNNTFRRVANNTSVNKWVWVRGSTGVIANNVMDRADSPDGSTYPNKAELKLSVGCPTAYPVQYQIGQAYVTPESRPSKPLAIFGNTGAGTTDSDFIRIEGSQTAGPPCGTPGSYIQLGRDYVLSNTWGWRPYTYPHPLQSIQAGAPGAPASLLSPPNNLRVQ
jgi:hypothetical protein